MLNNNMKSRRKINQIMNINSKAIIIIIAQTKMKNYSLNKMGIIKDLQKMRFKIISNNSNSNRKISKKLLKKV